MTKSKDNLIESDNRQWTEADFENAVSFRDLPTEMQELLSSPVVLRPDTEPESVESPAA